MRNKKGFMLIVAYSVVAVILILIAAYVARSVAEMRIAQRERDSLAALAAAESGIDYGLEWLTVQPAPPAGVTPIVNPVIAGVPQPALTTGAYAITVIPNVGNPTKMWPARYEIVSVGTAGDSTRTVYYEVQQITFAKNIWFTNLESFQGTDVWFVTGDSLNGPVHTNDSLNISGNPSFPDLIDPNPTEEHGPSINYMHPGTDNPYFAQPVNFNVASIPFPPNATTPLRNAAASGGNVFTGTTTITLNANGTMNVTNANGGLNNKNMPIPANGAIFVQNAVSNKGKITDYGDVNVSGTLNGRLSIGADDNINIAGNVQYNNNPQVNPASTDTLGLIAQGDVIILQGACPNGPTSNLTIQASVMAMADSFYLENWDTNMKGALNIYGGITQNQRGAVGTFNTGSNSKASGFSKNYIYDRRLKDAPPPYFPDTPYYDGIAWREQ